MPNELYIFLLYLFYGMAFFAIGVSITSRDIRFSQLELAGSLWLLALFAYSHAFHEWFELYQQLPLGDFPEHLIPLILLLRLLLVLVSFSFLLLFGIRTLSLGWPAGKPVLYLLPVPLIILLLLSVQPLFSPLNPLDSAAGLIIDSRIRNLVGLPAALSAGFGLILYSRTLTHISTKGANNFAGAGIALILYGILTGLIPSGTNLPLVNAPIELFRGLTAFVILHFVMHALHIFDEERKLLVEERLSRFAKAEKLHALGKLAFGIAHEINNPLANVSIGVEILKSDLSTAPTGKQTDKQLASIERNLDRASNIARELLVFSTEKESGFVPTSLNDIIDATLELLGSRRKDYRITIVHGAIPDVIAIPWKLEEVLLNLLVNAMDATATGGHIHIESRPHEAGVEVLIEDSGCGISPDIINQVMDPFFTTKEVGQGTGLGLSICYGIMELHGGRMELGSKEKMGTQIRLIFPDKELLDGENSDR